MLASWYDQQGPAAEVLQLGELPDPTPGPGEVRVRVTVSGANPGDTKKRRGWTGSAMPYPRVIPHSDAAGIIDSVGDGVAANGAVIATEAKRQAARDLTAAAAVGALTVDVGVRFPFAGIAQAHDRIDDGGRGRVLIDIPQ